MLSQVIQGTSRQFKLIQGDLRQFEVVQGTPANGVSSRYKLTWECTYKLVVAGLNILLPSSLWI